MSTATAQAKWLKAVWARFPDGPVSESEAQAAVLGVIPGAYEGDFAYASAVLGSLTAARCVTVQQGEGREFLYARGEWTDWPENRVGSEAYNAELQRAHEERERMQREEDQRVWDLSPQRKERDVLIALIDERIDARIGELLGSLNDPAVSRLRERLTDNAGEGRSEGDEDEQA